MMPINRDNISYPIPISRIAPKNKNELVIAVNSKSPEDSFFLEASAPATPALVMSGGSSAPSTSPQFTPSSSSPVTPVTDFQISNQDWAMPRLSEEFRNPGALAQTRIIPPSKALYPSPIFISGGDDFSSSMKSEISSSMEGDLSKQITNDSERPTSSSQSPHKRQRSGESYTTSFSRFTSRLPSFSRRWRHRKNSSLSTGNSGDRTASSRSSSVTSIHDNEFLTLNMPVLARYNSSALETSPPGSPYEVTTFPEPAEDPIDRKKLSSTPLLPPKIEAAQEESIFQDPLRSPSVAPQSRATSVASVEYSPLLPHNIISAQPSISSFHQTRKTTGSIQESSTILSPPPPDKWSDKLGHANFTIHPEPYIPAVVDHAACLKLVADWEEAHAEFFKQQARTLEHYGPNSKIYKLTEEKWADIDAEWRFNVMKVMADAVAQRIKLDGLHIDPNVNFPKRIPKFNPHIDGKFPTLGDGTIVGPMEIGQQLPKTPHSPPQKSPSTKFFRFFSKSNNGEER